MSIDLRSATYEELPASVRRRFEDYKSDADYGLDIDQCDGHDWSCMLRKDLDTWWLDSVNQRQKFPDWIEHSIKVWELARACVPWTAIAWSSADGRKGSPYEFGRYRFIYHETDEKKNFAAAMYYFYDAYAKTV